MLHPHLPPTGNPDRNTVKLSKYGSGTDRIHLFIKYNDSVAIWIVGAPNLITYQSIY